ncbi:hypothetical protein ACIQWZ_40115 [Streptomyces sp. NPDC098077]|uniref:hypothetical protein n=1 Tax=Streptomyces sp. NPDC098077 TaxID=3366093 RepID=UPI00380133AF
MTYNFGLHFTQELGNHFGSPTASWPATAEHVTPFLAIVVNVLGMTDGARWFEAAGRAHQKVVDADEARTYNFGFAHYLDTATGAHQEITLPREAAFEAMKGMYVLARRDSAADVHAYFDWALPACSREAGHTGSTPVAAAASA